MDNKNFNPYIFILVALPLLFLGISAVITPPPAGGAYLHNELTPTLDCPTDIPDSELKLSIEYLTHCYGCIKALTPTGTPSGFESLLTQIPLTATSELATVTAVAQLTATNDINYTPYPTGTPSPTITPTSVPEEMWVGSPVWEDICSVSDNQGHELNTQYNDITFSEPDNLLMGILYESKNIAVAQMYGAASAFTRINLKQLHSININWVGVPAIVSQMRRTTYDATFWTPERLTELNEIMGYSVYYPSTSGTDSLSLALYDGSTVPNVTFEINAYGRSTSPDSKMSICGLVSIYPIYYGINQLEPTPIPEPTKYPCNEYEYEEKIQVVDIGDMSWITGECFTILPGKQLIIPGTDDETIGWAEVQLCPTFVNMPELQLFGIEISLSMLAVPFVLFLIGLIMKI